MLALQVYGRSASRALNLFPHRREGEEEHHDKEGRWNIRFSVTHYHNPCRQNKGLTGRYPCRTAPSRFAGTIHRVGQKFCV